MYYSSRVGPGRTGTCITRAPTSPPPPALGPDRSHLNPLSLPSPDGLGKIEEEFLGDEIHILLFRHHFALMIWASCLVAMSQRSAKVGLVSQLCDGGKKSATVQHGINIWIRLSCIFDSVPNTIKCLSMYVSAKPLPAAEQSMINH